MHKGQTHTVGYAVRSRCYCKKVKPHAVGIQCAVGVSAKRSYGWWGPLPLVQTGQTTHTVGMQYEVGTQCAVGISAKRSTGTVDLGNMGGGDCYL